MPLIMLACLVAEGPVGDWIESSLPCTCELSMSNALFLRETVIFQHFKACFLMAYIFRDYSG
jgi:hypothetical protein